jgi:hypothetical protein
MRCLSIVGWLGLTLLAAAPLPWAVALAQSAAEMQRGEAARVAAAPGSRVNVRSGPEIESGNVVGQVGADAAVTVEGAERRGAHVWYEVTTAEGLTGWIRGDLLEPLDPGPSDEPIAPPAPASVPSPPAAAPAPGPAATEDWTRFVPELLHPIDACIRSLSIQEATITRVFQVEPDMVGVRLHDRTGRRWECLITRRSNYPLRLDPLGDRIRPMPGDGNPIFTRAPGEPPSDPCLKTDELKDPASGELLGWRSWKTC